MLLDDALTGWINAFAGKSALLDALAIAVTRFGVPLMIVLVAIQWWGAKPREKLRQTTIVAGMSFVIGLGLAQLILLFVHRVRPYDAGVSHLLIDKTVDWSFPSDHAIASVSIAATFLFNGFRKHAMLFALAALLVCFSRIYVGMHYMTDILGGAALASATAWIVTLFYPRGSRLDRWLVTRF